MIFTSLWLALVSAAAPASRADELPPLPPPPSSGVSSPQDAALVVGIRDYRSLDGVHFAWGDARAFQSWLTATRGVPADRVRVIEAGATCGALRASLDELGQRVTGEEGTAWIYFAGHGAVNGEGERVLLCEDAPSDDPLAASITLEEAITLASAGGGWPVLALDAGFSGLTRAEGVLFPGSVPAARPPARPATVWIAAGDAQAARDLNSVGHGAFTYLMLGALSGWADGVSGAADGRVTAGEVADWLQRSAEVMGPRQNPVTLLAGVDSYVVASGALEAPRALVEAAGPVEVAAVAGEVAPAPAEAAAEPVEAAPTESASVVAPTREALLIEASLAWDVVQQNLEGGTPYEKRTVLQQFIERYQVAAYQDGDQVVFMSVPEVEQARALLGEARASAAEAAAEVERSQVDRLGVGFTLGTQTGARIEFKPLGRIDAVGLRAGVTLPYHAAYTYRDDDGFERTEDPGFWVMGEVAPYLEINLVPKLDLALAGGLMGDSTGLVPAADFALQVDPESAFQLDFGVGVGILGVTVLTPRIAGGLVW
jgi:hypothetical protein